MDTHFNPMMFGLTTVPSSFLPPAIRAMRDQAVREAEARERDLMHFSVIGVSRTEIEDHERAVVSFAQSTVHPNNEVIRNGMNIARRAAARHGTIIPRVIRDWVAEILAPFHSDDKVHARAVRRAIPTAYRIWAPLIEKYGPLPQPMSMEDFGAALNAMQAELREHSGTERRPSWRDGLRRPWYER